MTRPPEQQAAELRRRAEAIGDARAAATPCPESPDNTKHLARELSIHQIELEIQSEELRIAQVALDESVAQASGLYDRAPMPYFTLDTDGKIKRVNRAGGKLLRVDHSRLEGKRFDSLMEESCRAEFNTQLQDLFASQPTRAASVEVTVGGQVAKALHLAFSLSSDRQECRVVAIDITERKRAVTALAQSNALLNTLLQTIPFPMDIVDAGGRILFSNGVIDKAVGVQGQGRRCWELYKDNRQQCLNCPLHNRIEIGQKVVTESEGVLGGKIFEIHHTGMMYAGQLAMLEVFLDITEREHGERARRAAEATVWGQANYDSLTGLPNRNLLHDRLERAIKSLRNKDESLAILIVDIDNLKSINESEGCRIGDQLLIEVARRIQRHVRAGDTVARLGCGEFIVILPVLDDLLRVEQTVETIHKEISLPFQLDGKDVHATASIGVTRCPDDGADVETLLKNAGRAMHAARAKGRNRYSFFTAEMQQEAQAHRKLSQDLHLAVQANQFTVYYQPIIDLTSGQCVKAEALVRWRHPHRGIVLPGEFIALAEQNELIGEIGFKVLKSAAEQLKLWAGFHATCRQVCINQSAREFILDRNRQRWLELILESGLAPSSFNIEITEEVLTDEHEGIKERLLRYGEIGVEVSIDDFGSGNCAVSSLRKYHLDYVKIDRSFVAEMATNANSHAVVEAIIAMAHKLSMKTVAEGVETEEQLAMLRLAGCDQAQGYFFARPMPASEFREYLGRTTPTD